MYGNTAFDHGHCSISSACIVKDGLHMEQGNYGENFDRGYEEQARPRQQVIVIGEPVPDKRTTKNLAICSLVLGILAIVFSFLPYIGIILALIALPQGIVSLVQKRLQGLLQEYSEYYCRYCLFWCMLLRYLLYNTGIG